MKKKKTYLAKLIYSIYVGVIMGFIITSVFLVVMTNVDKYFFNSYIGIKGDWIYYLGTFILVPIFGLIYVFNKRINIDGNILVLRENSFSFTTSRMDISSIKSVTLHEQVGKRIVKHGIKFADGETALMIMTKPFSNKTISLLLGVILSINSEVKVDEYYTNIIKSN